jgi:cell division protein FtsQ
MKQLKNILFLVSLIAYMVTVSGFISSKEKMQKIKALKIRIVDSAENQFIRSAEIRLMLDQKKYNLLGKESCGVDLEEIERSLKTRQIINQAEVFITEPGELHIEISQKTPLVRIFNRYGQGYYLDREGNVIPLSQNFSPFVIVANGFIAEPFTISKTMNINEVRHDSLPRSLHTVYDVYRLAEFITNDDFWNSQIEQIYVNNNFEFELIPRVGSNIIELGRVEDLNEKFENLKILYLRGFNNLGWNKYEKISLKYKNQVVCTKIQ